MSENKPIIEDQKKLTEFRDKYFANFKKMAKVDRHFSLLVETFKGGKNTFAGVTRLENKSYSADFIEMIEGTIGSLESIVAEPHKFIMENPQVVEVEKAKRITYHSVRHMAQHTENISSVGRDGSIDPKRVLNMFIEDELKIYENRFIMTLIRRLQTFIELRYKYILEHSDTRNSDVVTMKSEVKIGEVTYEMETKLKVVQPSDDEGHRETNEQLLNRLLTLRKRTIFLTTSRFMQEMAKAAPVTDPVLQTNIMRLNYEYQNAYKLWTFINRYDSLGIEYKFQEKKTDFNETYLENLNLYALASYLTIESEHKTDVNPDSKIYYYKPKFTKIELDYDMTDERIFGKGNPFGISNKKVTDAQIEAKLKRQQLAEEKRLKRLEEKARQKELKKQQKEEAKRKAELKQQELKRKAEEKKAKEAEKKRLKALEDAELARLNKLKMEELKRLEQARIDVAKVAKSRSKKK